MLVTLGDNLTISGRLETRRAVAYDLVERTRITAELNAAVSRVRAGNVQLVRGDTFTLIKNLDCVFVVFSGIAEDVGDDDDVFDLLQVRHLLLEKRLRADVLQADGVQHSCGSLPQTGRRIADHGLFRESLYDEAAELRRDARCLQIPRRNRRCRWRR